ncbi:MAG: ABC transporter ATP-binding protein, partial [Promethearchaeota archaeon]
GLIRPNQGEVLIVGENGDLEPISAKTSRNVYRRFGFCIDIPAFYGGSTPRELLKYFCKLKGIYLPKNQINEKIKESLQLVGLNGWEDQKIKTFSKGMNQRLGLAQAIVHDPDILVLDEPQSGLDPKGRVEIREVLKKLKDQGKTIFFSSHMIREISELCDRIAIINRGKLISYKPMAELQKYFNFSEIQVGVLEPIKQESIEPLINELNEKLQKFKPDNLPDNIRSVVSYYPDHRMFNLIFNGNPTSKKEILQMLVEDFHLPVISFYEMQTSRLEKIYIDLINQDNLTSRNIRFDKRKMKGGKQ